jgi:hypothetical protein
MGVGVIRGLRRGAQKLSPHLRKRIVKSKNRNTYPQ